MPLQVKKVQLQLKDGNEYKDGDLLFNLDAEAWAKGTRNGQVVSAPANPDNSYPHAENNAKYYAESVNDKINQKIPYPVSPKSKFGISGQVLRTDGNGGTEWVDIGTPESTQVKNAVDDWMDDHPTDRALIEDHSLTYEKLVNGTLGFVTPQMFGAKGDGETNDTTALKECFANNHCIFIPDGTYMVQGYGEGIIDIQSNTTVLMSENATLKVIANDQAMYYALRIKEKSNIIISGGNIIGDFDAHTGSTGEAGMGIGIYYSSNIIIENVNISNCWGDGVYVAADLNDRTLKSNNIKIENCTIHHNRRQGISLAGCDNISILNNTIHDIGGTNPEGGIDCEPNVNDTDGTNSHSNTKVLISGNYIYNTNGFSIQLYNGNDAKVINNRIDSFENRKNYLPVVFSDNILTTATIGTDNTLNIINCKFTEKVIIIGSFVNGTIVFENCNLTRFLTQILDSGANANKIDLKLLSCYLESSESDVTAATNASRIMNGTYHSVEIKNCSYITSHERGFGEFKGDEGVIIDNCSFDFKAAQYNTSGIAFDIASANKNAIITKNIINYNNCTYKSNSGSFNTNCDIIFNKNIILNNSYATYIFRAISTNAEILDNILPVGENRFADNSTTATTITYANNINNKNPKDIIVTPEMYGAAGDGVKNDTTAVQAALNTSNIVLLTKTYLVSANAQGECLKLNDNNHMIFRGAEIKLAANALTNYAVIDITGVSGCRIDGDGKISGDKETHTGTSGEWGHVIQINNSKNIDVSGVSITNGWGDGIYVGSGNVALSENIYIHDCDISDNSRNNISVIAADHIRITNVSLNRATRKNPKAGIDVEPNNNSLDVVRDCIISGCSATGNTNGFLALVTAEQPGCDVIFENCITDKNFIVRATYAGQHVQLNNITINKDPSTNTPTPISITSADGSAVDVSGRIFGMNADSTAVGFGTSENYVANNIRIDLDIYGTGIKCAAITSAGHALTTRNNVTGVFRMHMPQGDVDEASEIEMFDDFLAVYDSVREIENSITAPSIGCNYNVTGEAAEYVRFNMARVQKGSKFVIKNSTEHGLIIHCTPLHILSAGHVGTYVADNFGTIRMISDIGEELGTNSDNIGAYVYDSAGGSDYLTIENAVAGTAAKQIIVDITAEQDGEGNPSSENVRTISGKTAMSIRRTGKNLWGGDDLIADIQSSISQATVNTSEHTVTYSTQHTATKPFFTGFKPDTQYTIMLTYQNSSSSRTNMRVLYTDGTNSPIPSNGTSKETVVFVTSANKSVEAIQKLSSAGTTTVYANETGVFEGVKTSSDFEAYVGNEYSVDISTLAGTVYGGKIKLSDGGTGELTVTHWHDTILTSSLIFEQQSSNSSTSVFRFSVTKSRALPSSWSTENMEKIGYKCDKFAIKGSSPYTSGSLRPENASNTKNLYIYLNSSITTVEQAAQVIGESFEIVYPMKEADYITYTLNNVPAITMLSGENNVFSDSEIISKLKCLVNTGIYIGPYTDPNDYKIVATTQVANDEYFMAGGRLYNALSAVTSGGILTPGTNCVEMSIADALNKQSANIGYVTPEMFGAKGDGITDDSLAIQAAFNVGGTVLFSNKIYLVSIPSNDNTFQLKSNTDVEFAGATIKLATHSRDGGKVFRIANCENVKMNGPGSIVGDRLTHIPVSDQQGGALISIRDNTKNIYINGLYLTQGYGDGIYIGEYSESGQCPNNIYITNCTLDSNRRNGISIISGTDVFIDEVLAMNHVDQSPKSGIDIEPNYTYNKILVKIGNYYTKNNDGSGLSLSNNSHTYQEVTEEATPNYQVYIGRIISENDSNNLINSESSDNTIVIDSFIVNKPTSRALTIHNESKSIVINNMMIKLPANYRSGENNKYIFYNEKSNVKINNLIVEAEDDLRYGFTSNRADAVFDIGTLDIRNINFGSAIYLIDLKVGEIIKPNVIITSAEQYNTIIGDNIIIFDASIASAGDLRLSRNYAIDGHITTIINMSEVGHNIRGTSSTIVKKDGAEASVYSLASKHTVRFIYSKSNTTWYEI